MNNIWAIYKREMRTYFTSPLAYVLYVLFSSSPVFLHVFQYLCDVGTRIMMQSQFGAPQLPNYTETVLLGNAESSLLFFCSCAHAYHAYFR